MPTDDSEPSTTPPAPKRRGRPKAAVAGVTVGTWLRSSEYDQLIAVAKRHELSVSEFVRRLIHRGARVRE